MSAETTIYAAVFIVVALVTGIFLTLGAMQETANRERHDREVKACMPYVSVGGYHFDDRDYAVCKDNDGFRIKETERPAVAR